MSIKGVFVGCITALLGAATTGCANSPSAQDTQRILNQIPDQTTVDPVTGCRYIKDEKHPDKPQRCLPNSEFPKQTPK
jgi:hypothetical protein